MVARKTSNQNRCDSDLEAAGSSPARDADLFLPFTGKEMV